MAGETGALSYRVMPTLRFFKIGVNFDMVQQRSAAHNYSPDNFGGGSGSNSGNNAGGERTPAPDWNQAQVVSEFDKGVIRELQEDLPLIPRPLTAWRNGWGWMRRNCSHRRTSTRNGS